MDFLDKDARSLYIRDREVKEDVMKGSRYVPISRDQLESVLIGEMGFHEIRPENTWERVYARPVTTRSGQAFPYEIVVYSSVDRRSDVSRDCGEDAIRVVLMDSTTQRPYKKAERRVFRTKSAIPNLRNRCRDVFRAALEGPHCPRCSALMVERKGGPSRLPFLGCSHYAPGRPHHCTGTRELV